MVRKKKAVLSICLIIVLLLAGCKTQYKKVPASSDDGFKIILSPDENETAAVGGDKSNLTEAPAVQNKVESGAKPEEIKCTEAATLGYISCDYDKYDVKLSVKNTGKLNLTGVWIHFYDKSLNLLGEDSDIFEFALGDTKEILLKTSLYPKIERVEIFPIESGKICINKQLVLTPENSCR